MEAFFDGLLLGDGNLCKPKQGNAYFSYNTSSEQHALFVHSFLKKYTTPTYSVNPVHRRVYDKRNNKYHDQYWIKSFSHLDFTDLYHRWYQAGKKIIPSDVIINNLTTLLWYIGDGQLVTNSQSIYLHTNSFSKEHLAEFILPHLIRFQPRIVHKENKYWLISIPRKNSQNFLKYIGPCPFEDYKHKWNYIDYRNLNIKHHGFNFYQFDLVKNLFIEGHTIYNISKKLNIPIKSIKNHFDNNNVHYERVIVSKPVLQFTLDGEFINEFLSITSAANTYGINIGPISECCRGKRRQYYKFIWKYKI